MDYLLALDQNLFLSINSFNFIFLNNFMTFLSGQLIWLPVVSFFILMGYKQLAKKEWFIFLLFIALVITASDVTSSYLLKNIFKRFRPCKVDEFKLVINQFGQKCGGKYGFVSSHAANSMSLVIFSMSILKHKKWFIIFWLMPLLVGYSRIYLGVHYPADILGGFVVGSFWAYIFVRIFQLNYGASRDTVH
jgi:undecaprenyl-diphosphatase